MANFKAPTEAELDLIYATENTNDLKCRGSNEWTSWNSLDDPENNILSQHGDDFETLHVHQIMFK